jgi:starch synthase
LPEKLVVPDNLEFYGQVNYLKAGLLYADAINTVSPTYAKQIASDPMLGGGLEGVLQTRGAQFTGIANGLDVNLWNPSTDAHLPVTFDEDTLSKRALCKKALQEDLDFAVDAKIPLLGFVGRLDPQKGVDVLINTAEKALGEGSQLVVIGMGHPSYVEALRRLQVRYSTQMHVQTDFAETLAHKVYGGVDVFLMPSRYEPCGLSQLIAMRYGAIPVVSPTGGLLDTVNDVRGSVYGTGFIARDMSSEAFRETTHAALTVMNNKKVWLAIQKRAMSQDHSWNASVKSYLELYKSARAWRLS